MAKTQASKKRDDGNKAIIVKVRVSAEQKRALQAAADRDGLELSTWLRHTGLRIAGTKSRE